MSAGDFDRIFAALSAGKVRYLVVGGVAVVLHGDPRWKPFLRKLGLPPD